MIVVIANNLPPAVRGRMKLWFVEPRANIFVSGVKDSVAESVIKYLHSNCPPESGLMIFQRIPESPGYHIWGKGDPQRNISVINGLQLIFEKEHDSILPIEPQHLGG
jgi:CRISPR-associated protein Cas2